MKSLPKIYVRSLAAYNAGIEHGAWIYAGQDEYDLLTAIQTVLNNCLYVGEEWEIVDSDGFHGCDITRLTLEEISEFAHELERRDEDDGKVLAMLIDEYGLQRAIEAMDDSLIGVYESKIDFVQQYVDDTYALEDATELVKQYFNYESFLRDLEIPGDIEFYEAGYKKVYAFRRI